MSSIKFLTSQIVPIVYYTPKAWHTIQYLVHAVTTEIGWWHMVDKMADGNYLITDTIVPKQTVSGGEADITKDDLAIEGDRLMQLGVDTSKLGAWGHSHVNMGTSPSGQDNTQAMDYAEDMPFLIRGIYNKKGEARVDVYDFERGLQFVEVINEIYTPKLTAEETADLDFLITTQVQARSFNSNTAYNNRFNNSGRRVGVDGYWDSGVWHNYTWEEKKQHREAEEKRTSVGADGTGPNGIQNDLPNINDAYNDIDWPGIIS